MFKKRFLKIATAMTCIVTLIMPHTSTVLATALTNEKNNSVNTVKLISSKYHEGGSESTESLSDEAIDKYDTKPYTYTFGGDTGTDILKIVREDDKEKDAYKFSDAFYCLDGNNSFPTIDGSIEYTRTVENFFSEKPSTLGLSDENYNSLCWLLDNMYLRKQMTTAQRATQKDALLTLAFDSVLNSSYVDRPTLDDIKAEITDDDIEVIQQWAIWYFTNNGEKTLQDIDFVQKGTDGKLKLPIIDLTHIVTDVSSSEVGKEKTDSMSTEKHEWLTLLYQYFVNTALTHKSEEYKVADSLTYPTIANKTITCSVDGENYKIGPFKVTAPSTSLTSSDYSITLTNGTSELLTSAYTIKDKDGNTISKKINEIFDTEYYVCIPVSGNTINTVKLNLSYTKFGTKASVWSASSSTYQPLVLLTKEGETVSDSVSASIEAKADLALRKFIIAVNDTEITDRAPVVGLNESSIVYNHKKSPVQVKEGDLVKYRIAVYNEGNVPGTATKITDYLPEGLEYVADNQTNINCGWSAIGNVVTTSILSGETINPFDLDKKSIDGRTVDIVCKVTNSVSGSILTNIAEIAEDNVDDIDSTPGSISSAVDSSYIGNTVNKSDLTDKDYYYVGQQDDDDFEKVIVSGKVFDLSLQKFITKVNGKDLEKNREPKYDTTALKNGSTNATYTTVKTPVLVQAGDIVTYTIRVYNEGEVDGYAENVADYLPSGLGYLVNYKDNIENSWALPTGNKVETVKLNTIANGTKNLKVDDFNGIMDLNNVEVVKGSVKLTSTALSSSNSSNLIKAFDGSDKLAYKDIKVTCIVLDDSNLKNIAEITSNLDSDKKEITDRDSKPNTVDISNYPGDDEKQDDNDYEILTVENKKFDLALQKFITALNNKEVKDRAPAISYKDGKITYSHTQTPLEVNNGDNVTYTIRVYNEGEVDGYVAEIADDIPEGLVFDNTNETNKAYGWTMYDASGNVTTDASKAKEIRTDYLSKAKSEARKENTLLEAFNTTTGNLHYLDVKAVFKVNVKSTNSTIINTAEITKDTDKDGNEVDDVDSTPNNKKDGEDDIDKERIHVGYFDLALKKDLAKAIVTVGDSTQEIGAVNGQLMKVEIHRKKINSTIVKFVYNITITNEGTIPGYAKEIKDYIPEGLQFVESDNTNWKSGSDNTITTNALENTLLQPGQTATVQVVLRWINGDNNLGLKTNIAEISKDYNDANDTDDIDSTPDNKKDGEDDIDDAPVILSISTGSTPVYIILTTVVLAILSTGVVMIKKFVL